MLGSFRGTKGSKVTAAAMHERELRNLSIVLIVVLFFAVFNISTNFIEVLQDFFETHEEKPIPRLASQIIFLWVTGLLWLTYFRWREAEKKQGELQNIFDSISPDIFLVLDGNGIIRMCNEAVTRVLGYAVDEVIGMETYLILRTQSICEYWSEAREKLERDGFHIGSATGRKKDGGLMPLEIVTGGLGAHRGAVMLLRDITERKRSAEKLRKREKEFSLAFENAKDAIFWADSETGLIANCNKAAEVLLEKKKGEIIGCHQMTLHPPQEARHYSMMFKKHLEQKTAFDDEAEVITKSGKIKPVHITASVTLVGEKRIIQGIFRDITERKRMEKGIKASRASFHSIVEKSAEGIIILDSNGSARFVNRAAKSLLKLEAGRFPGFRVRPGQAAEIEIQRNGKEQGVGEMRAVETEWEGEPALLVSVRDITERKQVGEETQRNYDTQAVINSLLSLSLEDVPLPELLNRALDLTLSIQWLAFESKGSIFLVEDDPEVLVMKAQNEIDESMQKTCTRVPFGECFCGQAASTRKIQFADCLDDRHETRYEGITPQGH